MGEQSAAQQAAMAFQAAGLAREIGRMANMLSGLDCRVHIAAARLDYEDMLDSCSQLLVMHVDFAEMVRRFQATRIQERGEQAARTVVPAIRVADNRMSV